MWADLYYHSRWRAVVTGDAISFGFCCTCSGGWEGENGTRGAVLCSTPHKVVVQCCATLTNPTHPINTIRTQACQSKLLIINALCLVSIILCIADCIHCQC